MKSVTRQTATTASRAKSDKSDRKNEDLIFTNIYIYKENIYTH